MKKTIAVIGDATIDDGGDKYKAAFALGKALIDNGYRIQSGGMGGVMEAAFKGAASSPAHAPGDIISILPGFDPNAGNKYADVYIPTGLDFYRNNIVAGAAAVVAIGGGAGTLSEIAAAWALKRLVIGYSNVDGWSAKLAGQKIDSKNRYENIPEDRVFGVSDADEVIKLLVKYLDKYDKYHTGIKY